MTKYFSFFMFVFLLSACTTKVMIDNPTAYDIKLTIDKKNYDIPAFEFKNVDLKKSSQMVYAINSEGDELINEEVNITGEGVLNITKSTYVIWNDIYCLAENYDKFKDKLDIKELVVVNDKEYEDVDFIVIEDVFIPKEWNHGLDEIFPDSVDLVNDYSVQSKIYTVQALEDEFGYFGDLDFSEYEEEDINAFLDSLKQVLQIEEE